jgi:hypothetical protein
LPEYQGSANKSHNHAFTGDSLSGQAGAFAIRADNNPVAATGVFSTTSNSSTATYGSGGGSQKSQLLKFAATPSGTISAVGAVMAKPPTIAIMWILRFI